MKEYILSVPSLIKYEITSVLAHIVLLHRHIRRICLIEFPPDIDIVDIDRIAIAVKFPHTWHRHCIPSSCIIGSLVEIHRTGIHVLVPVEVPDSVECKFQAVGLETSRHRNTVVFNNLRVLPVRHHFFLRRCRSNGSRSQHKSAENSCHLSFHNVSVFVLNDFYIT